MQRLLFKVVSIWVQIRDLYLYIFRHAIIVNAWIDDHTWRGLNHRNWGDDINYYFIKVLTRRPVISLYNFRLARRYRFKNYLCIGSLLGYPKYANKRTIVWGAGSFGEIKGLPPRHICSVRGKLTHDILIEKGMDCPKVYGDPALLLPLVYNPRERFKVTRLNSSASSQSSKFKVQSSIFQDEKESLNTRNQELETKRYRLGIIPHVADQQHPVIREIKEKYADEIIGRLNGQITDDQPQQTKTEPVTRNIPAIDMQSRKRELKNIPGEKKFKRIPNPIIPEFPNGSQLPSEALEYSRSRRSYPLSDADDQRRDPAHSRLFGSQRDPREVHGKRLRPD